MKRQRVDIPLSTATLAGALVVPGLAQPCSSEKVCELIAEVPVPSSGTVDLADSPSPKQPITTTGSGISRVRKVEKWLRNGSELLG